MADSVLWEYLEELPEQEAAWKEWQSGLVDRFKKTGKL